MKKTRSEETRPDLSSLIRSEKHRSQQYDKSYKNKVEKRFDEMMLEKERFKERN
jgi:hypothetical protein